jgi:hypothetical protein
LYSNIFISNQTFKTKKTTIMKQLKFTCLAIFVLATLNSFGLGKRKVYQLKTGITTYKCDIMGKSDDTSPIDLNYGTQFFVEKMIDDDVIISIIPYNNSKIGYSDARSKSIKIKMDLKSSFRTTFNNKYVGNELNSFHFKISKSSFETNAEAYVPFSKFSFVFGTVIVPIKVRFGDGMTNKKFDFVGNINAGIQAGIRLVLGKSNQFPLNFLAGASLTSVPVNAETTEGFIKENTNVAALTPSFSIVFEPNRVIQIGVYTGIDYLAGDLRKKWMYNNSPWIGFGIGANLFNQELKTPTSGQSD